MIETTFWSIYYHPWERQSIAGLKILILVIPVDQRLVIKEQHHKKLRMMRKSYYLGGHIKINSYMYWSYLLWHLYQVTFAHTCAMIYTVFCFRVRNVSVCVRARVSQCVHKCLIAFLRLSFFAPNVYLFNNNRLNSHTLPRSLVSQTRRLPIISFSYVTTIHTFSSIAELAASYSIRMSVFCLFLCCRTS